MSADETTDAAAAEAAFEQSQVALAVVDLQGRFVRVNAALARLTGRPQAEHRGRTVADVVGEDGRPTAAVLSDALDAGEPRTAIVTAGDRRLHVVATPLRAGDGRVTGASAVVVEVTRRERAEAQRADVHAVARRAAAESQLRAEIGTALEGTRGVEARVRRLLDLLVPRFADFGTLEWAPEPGHPEPLATAHPTDRGRRALAELRELHGVDAPPPLGVGRLLATGRPVLLADVPPPPVGADAPSREPLHALAPRSWMAVPLGVRGRTFAALTLGRTGARPPFGEAELLFAQDVAARSALSIDNERLFEHEHDAGLQLQRSLLAGELPRGATYRLSVAYRPTPGELELAGGDWHDAVPRSDGRLALVVGDIAGHGLSAATAMGQLRSAARALGLALDDPADVLVQLDAFAARTAGGAYATIVCAFLDPADGELVYAAAGHLPPLVVPERDAPRYLLGGRSAPLAANDDRPRPSAHDRLPHGATLLLYTDGLVERRDESLDRGLARLAEAATQERDAGLDPQRLASAVLAGTRQRDDVALLVARLLPDLRGAARAARPSAGAQPR